MAWLAPVQVRKAGTRIARERDSNRRLLLTLSRYDGPSTAEVIAPALGRMAARIQEVAR